MVPLYPIVFLQLMKPLLIHFLVTNLVSILLLQFALEI